MLQFRVSQPLYGHDEDNPYVEFQEDPSEQSPNATAMPGCSPDSDSFLPEGPLDAIAAFSPIGVDDFIRRKYPSLPPRQFRKKAFTMIIVRNMYALVVCIAHVYSYDNVRTQTTEVQQQYESMYANISEEIQFYEELRTNASTKNQSALDSYLTSNITTFRNQSSQLQTTVDSLHTLQSDFTRKIEFAWIRILFFAGMPPIHDLSHSLMIASLQLPS